MNDFKTRPCRRAITDFISQISRQEDQTPVKAQSDPLWMKLKELGTTLWLDTGDLEGAGKAWTSEMEGLTTNNTLLNAEIQKGLYDSEIPKAAEIIRAAEKDIDERDLVREISLYLNARHGLKLVQTFDCKVSVELHTDLAEDKEATIETALFLHGIRPDRFIVKIPFTAAGILAARELALRGIPVNHTLGFSARQNLLTAAVAGPDYVNIFMGRLNAWTAGNDIGDGLNVGERATAASQVEILRLREEKGVKTRQIGASIREGAQIASLAGLDVFTMPLKAAAQFHESNPAELKHYSGREFDVSLSNGMSEESTGLQILWNVSNETKGAIDSLSGAVESDWTPARLKEALKEAGLPNIFPDWSEQELKDLARFGKLPEWPRWRDEIGNGKKGLDALFTQAGLLSFSKDQAALDERVRSLL